MFRPPAPRISRPARRPSMIRNASLAAVAALSLALAATPVARVEAQSNAISLIRDAEIEAILRKDTDPILVAAGLQPKDVNLYLVGENDLNAFVSGGQNIFLNTGLIIKTENPNQLIGVIAHETGHIASGHLVRQNEAMRGATATRMLTFGLGILAAIAAPDPSAAAGLFYSADYFAALQMMSYTRVQESAADQAAAKFIEKSGASGKGLVDFFNNFRSQEVFSEMRRYPYFRSHPLSSDRIGALRERVTSASNFAVTDTPEAMEEHLIMVAKLKAFMNFPQKTYQDYPDTDQTFPAKYARAIAHYKALETERAITDIDAMLKDHPTNPYLWELKGQVLFESGRAAEAEEPYRKSVELAPDQPLLGISLSQTLLALKKEGSVDDAIVFLDKALRQEDDNPMGWRLLAEAYERKGDAGMARLATAEMNYSLGQLAPARNFGMRARELLTEGTPQYRRANDIINAAESNFPRRRRG